MLLHQEGIQRLLKFVHNIQINLDHKLPQRVSKLTTAGETAFPVILEGVPLTETSTKSCTYTEHLILNCKPNILEYYYELL